MRYVEAQLRLSASAHAPLPAAVYNNLVTTAPGDDSDAPVRVSFDGFFHRGYRKTSIRKISARSINSSCQLAPFGAELQQDQGGSARKHQQKEKANPNTDRSLFDGPKKKRKEKTSQTARRA